MGNGGGGFPILLSLLALFTCQDDSPVLLFNTRILLVGGPSGRLDFVLRALRALRPGDPRNDVVIGRENDRNVKQT